MTNKQETEDASKIYLHLVSREPPEVLSLSAFYLQKQLQHPEIEPPRVRRFHQAEDVPSEIRGKNLVSLVVGNHWYVWGYDPSPTTPEDRTMVNGTFERIDTPLGTWSFFQVCDKTKGASAETTDRIVQGDQRSLYRRVIDYFKQR